MDIIPTSALSTIVTSFKILFIVIGVIVVAINYFQEKEARKMERKLSIELPQSIHIVLSTQIVISFIFLGLTLVLLIFF